MFTQLKECLMIKGLLKYYDTIVCCPLIKKILIIAKTILKRQQQKIPRDLNTREAKTDEKMLEIPKNYILLKNETNK